jgi:hypothetical protein
MESRPGFDRTCITMRENYGGIIGDCDLSKIEWVSCQLQRKQGRCNQDHGYGFLAHVKGDQAKEGYSGGVCGDKYFKGHSTFAGDRARAVREIEVDSLSTRLRAIAEDTTFLPKVDALRDRLRGVREQSQRLLDRLPEDVARKLLGMAKNQNANLEIEVEYIDRVEDEKTKKIREVSRWIPAIGGAITGLSIANQMPIYQLGGELTAVRKAFASLDARRELGKQKLQAQPKILDQVMDLDTQVAAFEAVWLAFRRPSNLANLWMLSRRMDSQMDCMRVSVIAGGVANPSNNEIRQALRDAIAQLSANNGNRHVAPA